MNKGKVTKAKTAVTQNRGIHAGVEICPVCGIEPVAGIHYSIKCGKLCARKFLKTRNKTFVCPSGGKCTEMRLGLPICMACRVRHFRKAGMCKPPGTVSPKQKVSSSEKQTRKTASVKPAKSRGITRTPDRSLTKKKGSLEVPNVKKKVTTSLKTNKPKKSDKRLSNWVTIDNSEEKSPPKSSGKKKNSRCNKDEPVDIAQVDLKEENTIPSPPTQSSKDRCKSPKNVAVIVNSAPSVGGAAKVKDGIVVQFARTSVSKTKNRRGRTVYKVKADRFLKNKKSLMKSAIFKGRTIKRSNVRSPSHRSKQRDETHSARLDNSTNLLNSTTTENPTTEVCETESTGSKWTLIGQESVVGSKLLTNSEDGRKKTADEVNASRSRSSRKSNGDSTRRITESRDLSSSVNTDINSVEISRITGGRKRSETIESEKKETDSNELDDGEISLSSTDTEANAPKNPLVQASKRSDKTVTRPVDTATRTRSSRKASVGNTGGDSSTSVDNDIFAFGSSARRSGSVGDRKCSRDTESENSEIDSSALVDANGDGIVKRGLKVLQSILPVSRRLKKAESDNEVSVDVANVSRNNSVENEGNTAKSVTKTVDVHEKSKEVVETRNAEILDGESVPCSDIEDGTTKKPPRNAPKTVHKENEEVASDQSTFSSFGSDQTGEDSMKVQRKRPPKISPRRSKTIADEEMLDNKSASSDSVETDNVAMKKLAKSVSKKKVRKIVADENLDRENALNNSMETDYGTMKRPLKCVAKKVHTVSQKVFENEEGVSSIETDDSGMERRLKIAGKKVHKTSKKAVESETDEEGLSSSSRDVAKMPPPNMSSKRSPKTAHRRSEPVDEETLDSESAKETDEDAMKRPPKSAAKKKVRKKAIESKIETDHITMKRPQKLAGKKVARKTFKRVVGSESDEGVSSSSVDVGKIPPPRADPIKRCRSRKKNLEGSERQASATVEDASLSKCMTDVDSTDNENLPKNKVYSSKRDAIVMNASVAMTPLSDKAKRAPKERAAIGKEMQLEPDPSKSGKSRWMEQTCSARSKKALEKQEEGPNELGEGTPAAVISEMAKRKRSASPEPMLNVKPTPATKTAGSKQISGPKKSLGLCTCCKIQKASGMHYGVVACNRCRTRYIDLRRNAGRLRCSKNEKCTTKVRGLVSCRICVFDELLRLGFPPSDGYNMKHSEDKILSQDETPQEATTVPEVTNSDAVQPAGSVGERSPNRFTSLYLPKELTADEENVELGSSSTTAKQKIKLGNARRKCAVCNINFVDCKLSGVNCCSFCKMKFLKLSKMTSLSCSRNATCRKTIRGLSACRRCCMDRMIATGLKKPGRVRGYQTAAAGHRTTSLVRIKPTVTSEEEAASISTSDVPPCHITSSVPAEVMPEVPLQHAHSTRGMTSLLSHTPIANPPAGFVTPPRRPRAVEEDLNSKTLLEEVCSPPDLAGADMFMNGLFSDEEINMIPIVESAVLISSPNKMDGPSLLLYLEGKSSVKMSPKTPPLDGSGLQRVRPISECLLEDLETSQDDEVESSLTHSPGCFAHMEKFDSEDVLELAANVDLLSETESQSLEEEEDGPGQSIAKKNKGSEKVLFRPSPNPAETIRVALGNKCKALPSPAHYGESCSTVDAVSVGEYLEKQATPWPELEEWETIQKTEQTNEISKKVVGEYDKEKLLEEVMRIKESYPEKHEKTPLEDELKMALACASPVKQLQKKKKQSILTHYFLSETDMSVSDTSHAICISEDKSKCNPSKEAVEVPSESTSKQSVKKKNKRQSQRLLASDTTDVSEASCKTKSFQNKKAEKVSSESASKQSRKKKLQSPRNLSSDTDDVSDASRKTKSLQNKEAEKISSESSSSQSRKKIQHSSRILLSDTDDFSDASRKTKVKSLQSKKTDTGSSVSKQSEMKKKQKSPRIFSSDTDDVFDVSHLKTNPVTNKGAEKICSESSSKPSRKKKQQLSSDTDEVLRISQSTSLVGEVAFLGKEAETDSFKSPSKYERKRKAAASLPSDVEEELDVCASSSQLETSGSEFESGSSSKLTKRCMTLDGPSPRKVSSTPLCNTTLETEKPAESIKKSGSKLKEISLTKKPESSSPLQVMVAKMLDTSSPKETKRGRKLPPKVSATPSKVTFNVEVSNNSRGSARKRKVEGDAVECPSNRVSPSDDESSPAELKRRKSEVQKNEFAEASKRDTQQTKQRKKLSRSVETNLQSEEKSFCDLPLMRIQIRNDPKDTEQKRSVTIAIVQEKENKKEGLEMDSRIIEADSSTVDSTADDQKPSPSEPDNSKISSEDDRSNSPQNPLLITCGDEILDYEPEDSGSEAKLEKFPFSDSESDSDTESYRKKLFTRTHQKPEETQKEGDEGRDDFGNQTEENCEVSSSFRTESPEGRDEVNIQKSSTPPLDSDKTIRDLEEETDGENSICATSGVTVDESRSSEVASARCAVKQNEETRTAGRTVEAPEDVSENCVPTKGYCPSLIKNRVCRDRNCKFDHINQPRESQLPLVPKVPQIKQEDFEETCKNGVLNKADEMLSQTPRDYDKGAKANMLMTFTRYALELNQLSKLKSVGNFIEHHRLCDRGLLSDIVLLCEAKREGAQDFLLQMIRFCKSYSLILNSAALRVLRHAFAGEEPALWKLVYVLQYVVLTCGFPAPMDLVGRILAVLAAPPIPAVGPAQPIPAQKIAHILSLFPQEVWDRLNQQHLSRFLDLLQSNPKFVREAQALEAKIRDMRTETMVHNPGKWVENVIEGGRWSEAASQFRNIVPGQDNIGLVPEIHEALNKQEEHSAECFSHFVFAVTDDGKHHLNSRQYQLLGQIGTALMLENHHEKRFTTAFQILGTLHQYNLDYYRLQKPALTQQRNGPQRTMITPCRVILVAVEICLEVKDYSAAISVLEGYDWVEPSNRLLVDATYEEVLWRARLLKRLAERLFETNDLVVGTKVLKYFLSTISEDLTDKNTKLSIQVLDVDHLFSDYMREIIVAELVEQALMLFEYYKRMDVMLYVSDNILRALLILCKSSGKILEANHMFNMFCLMGIYTVSKPTKEFKSLKVMSNLSTEEIHLLISAYFQELYKIACSPQTGDFDKRFTVNITIGAASADPEDEMEVLTQITTCIAKARERVIFVLEHFLEPAIKVDNSTIPDRVALVPSDVYAYFYANQMKYSHLGLLNRWERFNDAKAGNLIVPRTPPRLNASSEEPQMTIEEGSWKAAKMPAFQKIVTKSLNEAKAMQRTRSLPVAAVPSPLQLDSSGKLCGQQKQKIPRKSGVSPFDKGPKKCASPAVVASSAAKSKPSTSVLHGTNLSSEPAAGIGAQDLSFKIVSRKDGRMIEAQVPVATGRKRLHETSTKTDVVSTNPSVQRNRPTFRQIHGPLKPLEILASPEVFDKVFTFLKMQLLQKGCSKTVVENRAQSLASAFLRSRPSILSLDKAKMKELNDFAIIKII